MGREAVPDATKLLRFRHLLEEHKLNEQLFAEVGRVLQGSGMTLKSSRRAPSSMPRSSQHPVQRNTEKKCDPAMHQTRKGKQWYFGMKVRIGVDSQGGLAHSAVITSANVHDKHPLPDLLHGQEQRVHGERSLHEEITLALGYKPGAAPGPRRRDINAGRLATSSSPRICDSITAAAARITRTILRQPWRSRP